MGARQTLRGLHLKGLYATQPFTWFHSLLPTDATTDATTAADTAAAAVAADDDDTDVTHAANADVAVVAVDVDAVVDADLLIRCSKNL